MWIANLRLRRVHAVRPRNARTIQIGYLIAGFIGACLLIWIVRALRSRTA